MAVANVVHQDYDLPPNIPTNSISSASNAAERGDGPGLIGGPALIPPSRRRLSPKGIAKLIGLRFMRTVRRGNLPFLILFFSCVVVFFSALTGVGYVEPPSEGLALDDPEFKLGQPVFDPKEDSITLARHRQQDALRELEMEWTKQKRPQDGKWMQKSRDHGARKMRQQIEMKEPKAAEPKQESKDVPIPGPAAADDAKPQVADAPTERDGAQAKQPKHRADKQDEQKAAPVKAADHPQDAKQAPLAGAAAVVDEAVKELKPQAGSEQTVDKGDKVDQIAAADTQGKVNKEVKEESVLLEQVKDDAESLKDGEIDKKAEKAGQKAQDAVKLP